MVFVLIVQAMVGCRREEMKILGNTKSVCLVLLATFLSIHLACPVLAADDEVQHFGVSAICGAGIETYLHHKTELGTPGRMFLGTMLGSIHGLTKEIIDSSQEDNYFSESDMIADVVGALVGTVVSSVLNDVIRVRIERRKEKRISLSLVYNF